MTQQKCHMTICYKRVAVCQVLVNDKDRALVRPGLFDVFELKIVSRQVFSSNLISHQYHLWAALCSSLLKRCSTDKVLLQLVHTVLNANLGVGRTHNPYRLP